MIKTKFTWLFTLACSLLLSTPAYSFESSQTGSAEAGARHVVEQFAKAWNAHDMNEFSHLFTSDAVWVNVRGNRWVGAEQIKANHVEVHQRFYGASRLEFSDVSVRSLSPDIAVVNAKETIRNSSVPAAAGLSADSQMSLVLVRRDDKWLIASGQNTNVAPVPPRPSASGAK